ncbi:hypothetical protein [Gynurincola endophyticus]|jgi:hypothetical protein|uniref:hypothetical protein n=1 Tax=Gynurincola endophyticus TaxID=2479004 RepID=UPI000F8E46FF|nr:hypothetical protein [Gynurincola endophyticus]
MSDHRFRDENKTLRDYQQEVWVKCTACESKAIARANYEIMQAELICTACGYNKKVTTQAEVMRGMKANVKMAAHGYFDNDLWLQHPFKNDIFWAYNLTHLEYLERYIAAGLREHTDRTHFTLLEKLPKFYHEAKNRETLLKIIQKLKLKS